jgi:hypothetical protein
MKIKAGEIIGALEKAVADAKKRVTTLARWIRSF